MNHVHSNVTLNVLKVLVLMIHFMHTNTFQFQSTLQVLRSEVRNEREKLFLSQEDEKFTFVVHRKCLYEAFTSSTL